MWGLVEMLDRFELTTFSKSINGLFAFSLVGLIIFQSFELFLLSRSRLQLVQQKSAQHPAAVFAASLISYARSLSESEPPKDQAILELRSWSSRLLHLMGATTERTELGQIALAAAAALQERDTQIDILIDDLGWSLFEHGDPDTAISNIGEALRMIENRLVSSPGDVVALGAKVKALRHLANIESRNKDLPSARADIGTARAAASNLSGAERDLHLAQLDHSEAEIILTAINKSVGPTGQVDPSGTQSALLNEASRLAECAETVFHGLSDHEREVKALKTKVDLLVHDTRKEKFREADARLRRLQREVARELR
ncbi:hypothetical protein GCM10009687_06370 [Asanoa iriomotensis]|uniref:Tetratricopeptide repeat protein n=2 Tax=Asanoa iriomotensis TaxID=234613 RepID=A0ABQ4C1P2_9ACTN|nr:hypothetical protein Air01nite_27830 [Asanoa iriomotensis]